MPYKTESPPDVIKNLPTGARKIWINTFNEVSKESDEESARKAAWSNVKAKYKKTGDNWVKKVSAGNELEVPDNELEGIDLQASIPELEEIEDPNIKEGLRITGSNSIIEFQEEEGISKAIFRVIQPGWSSNGYYYSPQVTSQLVPFIEGKPMFFADHLEPKQKKDMIFGQKLKDGVAIAEKAWTDETGQVFAKLKSLNNSSTHWIWEAAQSHPEHIGISIDAYGKVQKGEAEGKKGNLVNSFVGYDSSDFVYRPAAGGKFISITESFGEVTPEEPEVLDTLKEAAKSLSDVIKKSQKKSLFWNIGYMLTDFLSSVAVDNELTEGEKEKAVEEALGEFISQLKLMDPLNLFNKEIELNPQEKLKYKLEENMDKKELMEALKDSTPNQLRELNPALYDSIVQENEQSKEVKEAVTKYPEIVEERDELLKEKVTTEKKITDLEVELEAVKEDLKGFQEKEEEDKWAEKVDELIETSGIEKALITATFKKTLVKEKDEAVINELLEDRKTTTVKPDLDNGPEKDDKKKQETKEYSDDQFVHDIKSN